MPPPMYLQPRVTLIFDLLTPKVYCRAMLASSAALAVMRCPSVRQSVTFVDHVKTNKHIFIIFSPSHSHNILVFQYQRGCQYSDGKPVTGASNARWVWKIPLFDHYFHQYLTLSQKRLQLGNATRVPKNPGNPPVFKPVNSGLCAVKNPGFTCLI